VKSRESPSALLILSAVDLLLASLVCAVVLFIALVGARSGASQSQTTSLSTAPTTVHILFLARPDAAGEVSRPVFRIDGAEQLSPPTVATESSLTAAPFGVGGRTAEHLRWWTLVVQADATELRFTGIPPLAFVTLNLGTEGMHYLRLECSSPDWGVRLSLRPLRVLDEGCDARPDARSDMSRSPPKPLMVVTSVRPDKPPWQYLANVKTGNGMISTWMEGTDKSFPTDASTMIFSD